MSRDIYLVGSIPLDNAEQVFVEVSAAFGRKIKRISDGETAERCDWITWLEPVFASNHALQKSGQFFRVHETGIGAERYMLKPNYKASDVKFDNLRYAELAINSYDTFKRLKAIGKIHAETKFQVCFAPAMNGKFLAWNSETDLFNLASLRKLGTLTLLDQELSECLVLR